MSEISRDRWGRPLIIPPDGGQPMPYTRVSSMAKTLDDTSNLMAWKQRVTAVGLARRVDLRTRLAGVIASHADPVGGDGKRDLNAVCAEAAEAGGGSTAASTGTGIHELTEAVDRGTDPADLLVDEHLAGRLRQYAEATAALEVLAIETFVVNDELRAAGTFDRLVRLPDGRVVVADLKTGAHDANYPLGVAVQIAIYANGSRYDPDTAARSVLDWDLDRTTGLLIHLPQKGDGCRLYALDLTAGYRAALVAADVHEIRAWKAPSLATPYPTGVPA